LSAVLLGLASGRCIQEYHTACGMIGASPGIRDCSLINDENTLNGAEAAVRIKPLARRTPVMTSDVLDERSGTHVFLKCENLQRGGAFRSAGQPT